METHRELTDTVLGRRFLGLLGGLSRSLRTRTRGGVELGAGLGDTITGDGGDKRLLGLNAGMRGVDTRRARSLVSVTLVAVLERAVLTLLVRGTLLLTLVLERTLLGVVDERLATATGHRVQKLEQATADLAEAVEGDLERLVFALLEILSELVATQADRVKDDLDAVARTAVEEEVRNLVGNAGLGDGRKTSPTEEGKAVVATDDDGGEIARRSSRAKRSSPDAVWISLESSLHLATAASK